MAGNLYLNIGSPYIGTKANQPPNWTFHDRAPTDYDVANFALGDLWLDKSPTRLSPPQDPEPWVLVSKEGDDTSRGELATWVRWSGGNVGSLISLTGNSGGAVFGDVNQNVNVVGDGTSIDIVGNPGTNTLTASIVGGSAVTNFPCDLTGSQNPVLPNGSGVVAVTSSDSTITTTGNTNSINLQVRGGQPISNYTPDSGTNPVVPTVTGNVIMHGEHGINTTGALNQLDIAINNAITLGDLSVIVAGSNALDCTTGDVNIAAGALKLANTTSATSGLVTFGGSRFVSNFGTNNTFIGSGSGNVALTGTGNTALGSGAGDTLTTGSNNIALGLDAASTLTTETSNFLVNYAGAAGKDGLLAIELNDGSSDKLIMHNYPANSVTNGNNFFIGFSAGNTTMANSASSNYGIGNAALSGLTTGFDNIAIGDASLTVLTTGTSNIAIGKEAGYNSGGATGLVSGISNLFIGDNSGKACTSNESANVYINENGANTGESNTLRIGNGTGTTSSSYQLNKAFICGIRGITTGVADAIAVLVDSANQLGTVSSSLRYKTNVQELGSQSEVIYSLKPKSFEFRQHPGVPAWGLIAEEVDEVFPQLCVYKDGQPETVKYHDLVPLLLNEVQKLRKELDELKAQ